MTDKKTQLRKDEIMNAARAGIHRYTRSIRGTHLLGAACGISVVDGVLIIECDQQRFRITIHEE
jgi:hypothetical protein